MATKERLPALIDSLPDTPETERLLAAVKDELEPKGAGEDSVTIRAERRTALDRLAGYFDHPETAPWDWKELREGKLRAWPLR